MTTTYILGFMEYFGDNVNVNKAVMHHMNKLLSESRWLDAFEVRTRGNLLTQLLTESQSYVEKGWIYSTWEVLIRCQATQLLFASGGIVSPTTAKKLGIPSTAIREISLLKELQHTVILLSIYSSKSK